jgi:hypothetical protein
MLDSLSADGRLGATVIELSRYRIQGGTGRGYDTAPTLFVNFDGVLHVGRASMDEEGVVSLNTGRSLFEFAPLLIELLKPYPSVELVLTTSWLMTLSPENVIALMPHELARRVVGTTHHVRPRLSDVLNGTHRGFVIKYYALSNHLWHWLAVDETVGVRLEDSGAVFKEHFVLADSVQGLSGEHVQRLIAEWLECATTNSY